MPVPSILLSKLVLFSFNLIILRHSIYHYFFTTEDNSTRFSKLKLSPRSVTRIFWVFIRLIIRVRHYGMNTSASLGHMSQSNLASPISCKFTLTFESMIKKGRKNKSKRILYLKMTNWQHRNHQWPASKILHVPNLDIQKNLQMTQLTDLCIQTRLHYRGRKGLQGHRERRIRTVCKFIERNKSGLREIYWINEIS